MSLPENFPLASLSATNRQKLEWFYRRYVEEFYPEYRFGHFLLAAYAAVPALLTPDLLYKLWQNFHLYQWAGKTQRIHRVAVSDLLLSPLCREVGYELYEMEPSVRTAFLQWQDHIAQDPLWKERHLIPVRDIAAFLTEYHSKPNPARQRWGAAYEEVQEWNALAFTRPELLQQKIWQKLRQSVAGKKETETLRVLDFLSKAGQQLQISLAGEAQQNWQQHAAFAQAWKSLLQHNTQAFTEIISKEPAYRSMLDDQAEGGIAVQMPAAVKAELDHWIQAQEQTTDQQETIRAVIVGLNQYMDPSLPQLQGCRNDAEEFKSFLENIADYLGLPLEIRLLLDREATIEVVWNSLDNAVKAMQDKDHFVFFFAGNSANCLRNTVKEKDGTLYLYDSQPDEIGLWSGLRQGEIEDRIIPEIQERTLNCLLVLDHPKSPEQPAQKGYAQSFRDVPMYLKGSLVILYGAQEDQSSYERFFGRRMRGVFPFALLRMLEEKGFNVSFKNLIEATRLRMAQLIERQLPVLEAFPTEMENALLFSHEVFTGKKQFQVRFRPEISSYVLAAGARQGITPSLEFMHTLIKLEDERILTVDEVYHQHALLRNFTGDGSTERVYMATLLQTALPKVRIAFDPGIDEKMEAQLRSIIQSYNIYYIDIRDQISEAQYFIHSWEYNYLLSRQTSSQTQHSGSIKPLFNLEPNPYELIKQMEYIAQWSGILEYQNPRPELDRSDLSLEIELFDGKREDLLTAGKVEPTRLLKDPESISLRDFYRQTGRQITKYSAAPGMHFRSGFRVKMTHQGKRPLWIQALYLDSTYGIHAIGQSRELYPNQTDQWLSRAGEKDDPRMFLIDFPQKYLDLGITEINDYLKLIVSDKAIDLHPLVQESLKLDQETTRTIQYRQDTEKGSFTLGEADWLAITIPVRIRYSGTTLEDVSTEPSRPASSNIIEQDDLPSQEKWSGSENDPPYQQTAEEPRYSPSAIRELIAKGELQQAVEQLTQLTRNTAQENSVILLSGRLNTLEREFRNGLITGEEHRLSRNRLSYALLQLLDELDREQPA